MMLSSGVAVVLWYPQALAVSYQILTTMPTLSDSMTASSDTCTHALMDQIKSDVYYSIYTKGTYVTQSFKELTFCLSLIASSSIEFSSNFYTQKQQPCG